MKARVNLKYFASLCAWKVIFDSKSLQTLRTFTSFNRKITAIMLRKISKIIVTWQLFSRSLH